MKKPRSRKSATDQFIVRLPAGMRSRIELIAADEGRSMNSQIVMWLERAMDQNDDVKELWRKIWSMEDLISELNAKVFPESIKQKD